MLRGRNRAAAVSLLVTGAKLDAADCAITPPSMRR
jgi:hypothetical protein